MPVLRIHIPNFSVTFYKAWMVRLTDWFSIIPVTTINKKDHKKIKKGLELKKEENIDKT